MTDAKARAAPPSWLIRGSEPVAKLLAGKPWFPIWGVMHHRGRKSGTPYSVPVAIIPTKRQDIFLIGLPWGERTNWVQNVLAAGGATVTWKGRDYPAAAPRIVTPKEATAETKGPLKRVVGSGRFPAFIELDR